LTSFDRHSTIHDDVILHKIYKSIVTGEAEKYPHLLQQFVLLTHCDLKTYMYTYWFAFPVIKPSRPFRLAASPTTLLQAYEKYNITYADLLASIEQEQQAGTGAWLTTIAADHTTIKGEKGQVMMTTHPLSAWHSLQSSSTTRHFLTFLDPSNNEDGVPGWPLRNLLIMAALRWGHVEGGWEGGAISVLALRQRRGRMDASVCWILDVVIPHELTTLSSSLELSSLPLNLGVVSGWELGIQQQKPTPRVADLGAHMDPRRLAASAVDLNLSLMRWRAAPTLDINKISNLKCLLLGAGTLGCNVARTLLGWGVRTITFVDNSKVAFSNPVRQSLYTFQDCLEGGRCKAEAAATALESIFPDVIASWHDMSIPMPGHGVGGLGKEEERRKGVVETIQMMEQLVEQHDVVFLLTDTRESRWLPTLMCAANNKLAITAALGFESYLVMRHGMSGGGGGEKGEKEKEGESIHHHHHHHHHHRHSNVGCYFCNDIVAPTNSTIDRTMDQQCTVARPGLSAIAASLAVELTAAWYASHNYNNSKDKDTINNNKEEEGPLGKVPHMIRGQLTGFSQMCLQGERWSQCTACSEAVVERYEEDGVGFIMEVLEKPGVLEKVTGLDKLYEEMEGLGVEVDEEEEEGGDGEEGWAEL